MSTIANSRAWLSRGIESLAFELENRRANPEQEPLFDIAIIGSGYGGAIAASELSKLVKSSAAPLRVAVFERGKEYPQGSFPANVEEVPAHCRFSSGTETRPGGQLDGVFDFRISSDLQVVVANGIGGGSLINAGVMARAKTTVFDKRWPKALRTIEAEEFYRDAEQLLNVKPPGQLSSPHPTQDSSSKETYNSIARHADAEKVKKTGSLELLASDGDFCRAPISVSMRSHTNSAGVEVNACTLCGDCAAGCNHGAKNSLDQNLLKTASSNGIEIYTGATASLIEETEKGHWSVSLSYTQKKLAMTQKSIQVSARKLIVCAGSLGSTELLLRSQARGNLKFSGLLGKKFSSNGDNFIGHYQHKPQSNAIAFEHQKPGERFVGPTITGMIDRRDQDGVVIQEMSVATHLNRLFLEVSTTLNGVYDFDRIDTSACEEGVDPDPLAVNRQAFNHTSVYAAMGDDGSDGSLELSGEYLKHADGCLKVNWPELKNHRLFEQQLLTLDVLKRSSGVGGKLMSNPVWKLLPTNLMQLVGDQKGPTITVHPLGGCAMGDDASLGVVDDIGRVYDGRSGDPTKTFKNLVVLDGSILPSALGINPALTISALALRAIRELIKHWELNTAPVDDASDSNFDKAAGDAPLQLPVYRDLSHASQSAEPATFTILERLRGFSKAQLFPGNKAAAERATGADETDIVIELSLQTSGSPLAGNLQTGADQAWKNHQLDSNATDRQGNRLCKLRVFLRKDWDSFSQSNCEPAKNEQSLDELAVFIASLSGDIRLFRRERSSHWQRIWTAGFAWLCNRGLRDLGQYLIPRHYERREKPVDGSTFFPVASRAGSRWRLNYNLSIDQILKNRLSLEPPSCAITGKKTLTYGQKSNPWRQLSEVELNEFLGFDIESSVLELDTRYLADQGVALYQLKHQRNQVRASLDVFSFTMYNLRLLIHTHLWSFRLPDQRLPDHSEVPSFSRARKVNRLAREEPGIAKPRVFWLEQSGGGDWFFSEDLHPESKEGETVKARLALYKACTSNKARTSQGTKASNIPRLPILMLHGYSASSTTFSHPQLETSAMRYFHQRGHDVWLLDFRSSAALAGAAQFWRFEEIAQIDLKKSIEFIYESYQGQQRINLLAHCMGGAMLSMAICDPDNHTDTNQFFLQAINKIAFSQFSPTPVFTPVNTFRAILANSVKALFKGSYEFRGQRNRSLLPDILDRLLATLPTNDKEFKILNPSSVAARRTFARSKQRADALYARVMNLTEMDPQILNYFDDFFGPLNLETATQVMHFARSNRVTNFRGHNIYLDPGQLRKRWQFPTLSIHSTSNGMIDQQSGSIAESVFKTAGVLYQAKTVSNSEQGHQDAMIGKDASKNVFPLIAEFFDSDSGKEKSQLKVLNLASEQRVKPLAQWECQLPAAGPVLIEATNTSRLHLGFATTEQTSGNVLPLCIALKKNHAGAYIDPCREDIQLAINIAFTNMRCWRDRTLSPEWYVLDLPSTITAAEKPTSTLHFLLCYISDISGHINIDLSHNANTNQSAPFQQFSFEMSENRRLPVNINVPAELTETLLEKIPKALCLRQVQQSIIELSPASENLCFAIGSCQYPPGLLDRNIAYESYAALGKEISDGRTLDFALLMGDQIYSDATAGFMDPRLRYDRYVRPHINWFSQPEVREVTRRTPLHTMLDDHEVVDNWDPALSSDTGFNFDHGLAAFGKFQRGEYIDKNIDRWYSFEKNGIGFFMLDTRTARSDRTPATLFDAECSILGKRQHRLLEEWLLEEKFRAPKKPKFVVSPSLLLPRHYLSHGGDARRINAIHSDGWDGYPQSLQRLLAFIVENEIENLYFLSGDEHLNCYAKISLENASGSKSVTARSIHCSGLYAPFPFANSCADDFVGDDTVGSEIPGFKTYNPELGPGPASFKRDRFSFNFGPADKPGQRYDCICDFIFDLDGAAAFDPGAAISISSLSGFGLINLRDAF